MRVALQGKPGDHPSRKVEKLWGAEASRLLAETNRSGCPDLEGVTVLVTYRDPDGKARTCMATDLTADAMLEQLQNAGNWYCAESGEGK